MDKCMLGGQSAGDGGVREAASGGIGKKLGKRGGRDWVCRGGGGEIGDGEGPLLYPAFPER